MKCFLKFYHGYCASSAGISSPNVGEQEDTKHAYSWIRRGCVDLLGTTVHLQDVVVQAQPNDDSPADKTLFIYRPSFGRAGGNASSQFGEFDAIIATPKGVYLIESKWTGEPIFNGQVRLAGRQMRRHEVFRWIRERWLEQAPQDWAEFYNHNGNVAEFAEHFEDKPLAQPGHRLTSNLQYVLQQLPGPSPDGGRSALLPCQ